MGGQNGEGAKTWTEKGLSYEDKQERETDAPELFPCLPDGAASCRASYCVGLHAWLPRETPSAARTADLVSRDSGDTWMAVVAG